MKRAEVLDTAKVCITQDRAASYGPAENSFSEIAAAWNWWLSGKLKENLSAHDVSMMMVLFKAARIKNNTSHVDSYTDLCGYGAIAGEMGCADGVSSEVGKSVRD
jgi:hypothetical protein